MAGQGASARDQAAGLTEAYIQEPMPPGFKVMVSPLEGPIYTDANGRTLYKWPRHELRNGGTADMKGSASVCDNVKTTENAGMMSPYPGGFELPDLEKRPTCASLARGSRRGRCQAGRQVDHYRASRSHQAVGLRRPGPLHLRSR